jgi:hypothetical protein
MMKNTSKGALAFLAIALLNVVIWVAAIGAVLLIAKALFF